MSTLQINERIDDSLDVSVLLQWTVATKQLVSNGHNGPHPTCQSVYRYADPDPKFLHYYEDLPMSTKHLPALLY